MKSELIKRIEIKDKTGRIVGTKEVVTYQGLLSKAHEEGLSRVATKLLQVPSDENGRMAIARALIVTSKGSFASIGDASPENVNSFIVPHLIRMAETRAKARALRDAVNIGIVSFEELDGEGILPNGSDHEAGASAPRSSAEVIPMGRSRSAASGQTQVREQTPVEGESSPAAVPSAPSSSGNGAKVLMSEAQRRYLFRLLAAKNVNGEAAHEYLKDRFKVVALKDATKAQASLLIEELLAPPKPETVPSDDDIPY